MISVSHFALSGYWCGNPGLTTVARGCSLLRVTDRLHSGGHASLIPIMHIRKKKKLEQWNIVNGRGCPYLHRTPLTSMARKIAR